MNIKQESVQSFFDRSPIPTWVFDIETFVFLYVNQSAISYYGYTEDEFLRMKISDIRPPDDVAPLKEAIANEEYQHDFDSDTWRHLKKDGELLYARIYFQPIVYNDRKARLVQAFDVSKKVFAEQQNRELMEIVKQQSKQIDDILSTVKEIVWSRRVDNHALLYINNASIEVYGYTPEEMMSGSVDAYEHIHPDDRDKLDKEIEQIVTTGSGKLDYRIYHKDGSIRHLSGQAVLKKGQFGEPDVINGVSIEVTKLVEAEEALKEKELEVTNILENITDAFFEVAKDWKITYVNREFELLFNMKRDDLVGADLWTCFPRLATSDFNDIYKQAMVKGASALREGYSPGSGKWLGAYCYPTKKGMGVYLRDVTEERALRERIANNEQQLRAIINNTRDIIWSIDKDVNILTANQAFWDRVSAISGRKMPEEYAAWSAEHQDTNLVKHWGAYFQRALNGETYSIEEGSEYAGRVVYEEISFNPIRDKDNNIVGVSCFSRDITERKNYLLKIQSQNEKFKEIAWMLSHSVRSQVASILGLVQVFNHEDIADPENAIIIEGLESATRRLDKEIREIDEKTRVAGID